MSSITNENFIQALKSYHSDRMMSASLQDVSANFLESTGRTSIQGIRYTTMCLLVAQALENMLAGYGGHQTVDRRYISEAIGYQLGCHPPGLSSRKGVERYKQLFEAVYELQIQFPAFNKMLDAFIANVDS